MPASVSINTDSRLIIREDCHKTPTFWVNYCKQKLRTMNQTAPVITSLSTKHFHKILISGHSVVKRNCTVVLFLLYRFSIKPHIHTQPYGLEAYGIAKPMRFVFLYYVNGIWHWAEQNYSITYISICEKEINMNWSRILL